MDIVPQVMWSGLTNGCLYAVLALCLYVTFAGTGVLNFAQGDLAVAGMFLMLLAWQDWHWPLWLALLWTAAGGAVAGLILGAVFILPVARSRLTPVLTTLGAALLFEAVLLDVAGPDVQGVRALTGPATYTFLGARITTGSLWLVAVAGLSVVGILVLFRSANLGRLLMASFQDRLGSIIIGVSPTWVLLGVVGLGGLLSALVGGVLAPIVGAQYNYGVTLLLYGFTASVLGGMSRPMGPLVGGLIVGLASAFSSVYISSSFSQVLIYALIIVGLFLFPGGLASINLRKGAVRK